MSIVIVQPMILWLWVGGIVMVLGTLLALFPGRRRRNPLDPVSAPIATDFPPPASDPVVATVERPSDVVDDAQVDADTDPSNSRAKELYKHGETPRDHAHESVENPPEGEERIKPDAPRHDP